MQTKAESVFHYLTQADPVVSHVSSWYNERKKSNTTNVKWREPLKILEWEDFNFGSLRLMYDGLLQKALSHQPQNLQNHSSIPRYPFCEIHDENSLEALLVKWNQSIVGDALHETQAFLENYHIFEDVYMVRGGQACYPGFDPTFRPDWAGVQRIKVQASKPKNILPGDTKLGKKFSSQQIELGRLDNCYSEGDWSEPLKQVYNYCLQAKTRYGYIITEKELIVLRIRPASLADFMTPTNTQSSFESQQASISEAMYSSEQLPLAPDDGAAYRARKSGVLEFKAIPWQSDKSQPKAQEGTLTVNLALWWLHLMAMENHDIQDSYPALHQHKWQPSGAARIDSSNHEETSATGLNLFTAPGLQGHASRKRRRDDVSDEEDDFLSPIRPPPRVSPRLQSKLKSKCPTAN